MNKLTRHPLSAAMGEMEPEAFLAMQERMGVDGYDDSEPVILFDGHVLDGWNRYLAASGLGMLFPTRQFDGDLGAAADFVWRKHATRRNWNASQRALAESQLNRLRSGAPGAPALSVQERARSASVSPRTIKQADVVTRKAVPDVQAQVADGNLSIKAAEKIARLPRPEQRKAIAQPPVARKAKWAPATPPKPQVGASKEAVDEMKDALATLAEEVEHLTNRLAVLAAEAPSATEDERELAIKRAGDREAEIKKLRAELNAVKATNGELMRERNEMLSQMKVYRNQLAKYQPKAA